MSPSATSCSRLVVAPVGGQLDELVDQGGQLAALAVEVVEQLAARRPAARLLDAAQHRDVGAQAGQRRAQLVAGVLHQLLLVVAAAGQRAEHPVERRAQPAGLVGAVDRHLDVEAAGRGHVARPPAVSRTSRRVTWRAISQPRIAAATTAMTTAHSVCRRIASSESLGLLQRAGQLHRAARRPIGR